MEDEDYWNSSKTTGFSFDDEIAPVSSLFESSKSSHSPHRSSFGGSTLFGDFVEQPGGFKPIEALLSKHSLSCLLGKTAAKRIPLDPMEELSLLRQQSAAQWEILPVATTILNIRIGRPYALQAYRSLDSKKQLLTEAVNSGDGNAILPVVLYLSNTLRRKLFCSLLLSHPEALPVYINYLTTRFEAKTVVELLQMLGMPRDAAMKDFQFSIQPNQNIDKRMQRLKCLLRDHYSTPDVDDKIFLDNFMNYVDWQVSSGNNQGPLLGTVVTSLMYLCSLHWDKAPGHPLSHNTFISLLGVSERMFHWTAISARAASSCWDHIAGLVLTKGWLGGKKLRTIVSAERIVMELHRRNAPEATITEYFALIENLEKKLDLARKLSWHTAVIDTLVAMKDRQGLVQYQASLNPQSSDYIHAEIAIKSTVKWKN